MAPPAVSVQHHESALGRWEMARRAAPAALRPHVLGYLGYHEWTPAEGVRLPNGDLVVTIAGFLRFAGVLT